MKKTSIFFNFVFICFVIILSTGVSYATIVFDQGFETNTNGWNSYPSTITRTNGSGSSISPSSGSYFALISNSTGGAYTFFDGSRSTWPGNYTASIDIYVDPTTWGNYNGFDYSVSSLQSNGNFLRDEIFHVEKNIPGGVSVWASNNSNDIPYTQDSAPANSYVITTAGWYTFQQSFYDNSGVLAVDMNLFDSTGTPLWTDTLSTPTDLIPSKVGGNNYGWFTFVDVGGNGLAIDNATLNVPTPEPSTLLLMLLGLAGLAAMRFRIKKV